MPGIEQRIKIRDDVRRHLAPFNVADIMLGNLPEDSGIIGRLFILMDSLPGALELAYRRGYDAGLEDGKKGIKKPPWIKKKQRRLK